jgi:hypothetical protein
MATDAAEYGALLNRGTTPKLSGFSDATLATLAASLVAHAQPGAAPDKGGPRPAAPAAAALCARLAALEQCLEEQRRRDGALVAAWRPRLAELSTCAPLDAEGQGAAFRLAQYSGFEATPSFELTLQLLLSSTGDADLASINPHLSSEQRAAIRDLALAVCLASTREAHAARALASCRDLAEVLERRPEVVATASPEVVAAELVLKADTLAGILLTERHTVARKAVGGGTVFPPILK